MNLIDNPFHVLGVSPRDDRRAIVRAEEERSLAGDPTACSQARLVLSNPRNRVTAEVSWLPGVSPSRAIELVSSAQSAPLNAVAASGIPSLARANLLADALGRLDGAPTQEQSRRLILELAMLFERVDAEDVGRLINEDRTIAGFPEVESSAIEDALTERRAFFRARLKAFLDRLPSRQLIETLTACVEDGITDSGGIPRLVEEVAEAYEVEVQALLLKESRNIELLIEAIEIAAAVGEGAEHALERAFEKLAAVTRNWVLAATPIQVLTRTRGLDHDHSTDLARSLRGLAIDLSNDHGRSDLAMRITLLLKSAFLHVPRVVSMVEADELRLQEIDQGQRVARERSKNRDAEWAKEISYSLTYPHPLKISTEGIEWAGKRWPLETVSRLRWGGARYSQGGVQRVMFSVAFGNQTGLETMQTDQEVVFREFTRKLWLAVGSRLLTELVERLVRGEKVWFGKVAIQDGGLWLPTLRAGQPSQAFYNWSTVSVLPSNGMLVLRHDGQPAASATLSYTDEDNVHILEAAVRVLNEVGDSVSFSSLTQR